MTFDTAGVSYRGLFRMIFRARLFAFAFSLGLVTSPGSSAEAIKPPFGLRWGETTSRMERLLTGVKATVVERRTIAGREAWEVQGILAKDLQRTMFYFTAGELVEVELQYRTENWSEDRYASFMSDVRKRLEQKYGPPEQIARKDEPIGDVVQKVTGWKWNQNSTAIELFYYSAQNAQHTFRTLSVHYRAE